MMRQGANSAVRFTTYSMLKQFVQTNTRSGTTLPSGITFGIGAIAGLVTVYTTMPLDVIKTRMQSLEARQHYRNAFHCAYRIFTEEGVRRFWTGTTPRLARLLVSRSSLHCLASPGTGANEPCVCPQLSGGIVFTTYEKLMELTGGRAI